MADQLRVSLRLTAEDLLSEKIVGVLTKMQLLEQATVRLNGAATGASAGTARLANSNAQLGAATAYSASQLRTFGSRLTSLGSIAAGVVVGNLITPLVSGLLELPVAAIRANSALERQTITLQSFTHSASEAAAMVALMRQNAAITVYSASEVAEAGTGLITIARTAPELERALRLAEELAVLAPEQGLSGAAFALREAAAGQYTSLARRENIPLALIDQLKAQGFENIPLAEEAVRRMGVTWESVAAQGETFEGRLTTITSALGLFEQRLTAPVFRQMSAGLGEISRGLLKDQDGFLGVADAAGETLGLLVRIGVESRAGAFVPLIQSTHDAATGIGLIGQAWDALPPDLRARLSGVAAAATAAAPGITPRRIGEQIGTNILANLLLPGGGAAYLALIPQPDMPDWEARSGGVPPQGWRTGLGGPSARGYPDESERIGRIEKALHQLTAAQIEARDSGVDFRDETTREIEAQRAYGTELERTRQKVAGLDAQLQGFQAKRTQIGGYADALIADRAMRRRLGLPELAGETATIGQLLTAGYRQQLAEGPAALAAAQGHLGLGDWNMQSVQVDHQEVTAATVIVNGPVQGGGRMSGISGQPRDRWATDRYAGARSSGPAYQSGLGRFGQ